MTNTLVDIEKMCATFQKLKEMGYKYCVMSVPTDISEKHQIILQPYDADQDLYDSSTDINLN